MYTDPLIDQLTNGYEPVYIVSYFTEVFMQDTDNRGQNHYITS